MNWYVLGIILGSICTLTFILVLFFKWLTQGEFKSSVKRFKETFEEQVNSDIKIWAKNKKSRFIPTSYFKYNKKRIFKTDAILIIKQCLVVIKIKSIAGDIEGDAQKIRWTTNISNQKYSIISPILQNENKINHLMRMINMKIPTISIVVLSNKVNYISVINIPNHVLITKHVNLFHTLDELASTLPSKLKSHEIKLVQSSINFFKIKKKQFMKLYHKLKSVKK